MKRIAGSVLLLALLSFPAQAVFPLAFLAKEIVKGIVKDFLESQLNQMLAKAGPCGIPIADTGSLTSLAGMLTGRGGGMGGFSSLAGMGAMPAIPGIGAAAKGALPDVPGLTGGRAALANVPTGAIPPEMAAMLGGMPGRGGAAMPAGMAEMMKSQMAQLEASAKDQGKEGADGRAASAPDMAKVMQAMQDPTPLSAAEADELGTIMERMATAMPNAAPQCKPGELKTVMQRASNTPMGGGVMRMMLTSMREAQQKLDEARTTFATMSEAERADYVELMATEYRGWDKENQQAMLGMLETDFLGMPESLKTQLVARLKQGK
jgi:hypothetical protein